MLGYLDRANIGNAKTGGLERDFNLTSNQYSIVLLVFFISYVLFEIPSNLLIASKSKVFQKRIKQMKNTTHATQEFVLRSTSPVCASFGVALPPVWPPYTTGKSLLRSGSPLVSRKLGLLLVSPSTCPRGTSDTSLPLDSVSTTPPLRFLVPSLVSSPASSLNILTELEGIKAGNGYSLSKVSLLPFADFLPG